MGHHSGWLRYRRKSRIGRPVVAVVAVVAVDRRDLRPAGAMRPAAAPVFQGRMG
jgi:hypothetical protein